MHQDQRIGLGLAVLLLGAAGAFFFRNDPKPLRPYARLKSARQLDARISEMQNSPYLQSTDDEPDPFETNKSNGKGNGNESIGGSLSKGQSLNPHANWSHPSFADDADRDRSPIPFPQGTSENTADIASSTLAPVSSGTASDRVHVVQKGETLSSIAAKELGSSGRFSEIFDANRDQLNDANDVRVGMNLRIPVRRTMRPEVTTNNRTARPRISAPPLLPSDSDQFNGSDSSPVILNPEQDPSDRPATDTAPKRKFEAAKRVPLGAQGLGKQSGQVDSASKPSRKLSQLPPKDAGGKVAR